jgi:hypothetical protein
VWFLKPVSDKLIVDDYRNKIPNPMDIGTITHKLDSDEYATVADFCLDVRRIFANCLRYNTSIQDSFRALGIDMLILAEELMAHFLAKPEAPQQVCPPLLYCWRLCVQILDTVVNMKNPSDGLQTAHYFVHPAVLFFGSAMRADYLQRIKHPMDFGTITSNLLEGHYQTKEQFASDCRLVISNCKMYYGNQVEGQVYCEQASRIQALLSQQLTALERYDQSAQAKLVRSQPIWQTVHFSKPPVELLMTILTELRTSQYTDRLTKVSLAWR